MSYERQYHVLYVDDDHQECELVATVARTMHGGPPLDTVESYSQARAHLEKLAMGLSDLQRPSLLLLDYHLGFHTGVELLVWMKTQPLLNFPTAIFSNCENEEDILRCYEAGAAYFLRKPPSCKRLEAMLTTIHRCMASEPSDFEPLRLLQEYCPPSADPGISSRFNARRRLH